MRSVRKRQRGLFFSTGLGILSNILLDKSLLRDITLQGSSHYINWLLYLASCVIFNPYKYLFCDSQDNI